MTQEIKEPHYDWFPLKELIHDHFGEHLPAWITAVKDAGLDQRLAHCLLADFFGTALAAASKDFGHKDERMDHAVDHVESAYTRELDFFNGIEGKRIG